VKKKTTVPADPLSPEAREFFRKQGERGGKLRMQKLTEEQRRKLAQAGGRASHEARQRRAKQNAPKQRRA